MKILERFATIAETTAVLGPANLLSLLVAACLSGLLFGYRLLSQGYCRCFLTTR
ncbi:MAG TPA: hypothetical protein VHY09_09105 [Candidatus Methylacidiphilales bacterium]|jgi:hypothetical protein|nr:hypothetical protein [Candidatus Methylacidiphilales bacterium]